MPETSPDAALATLLDILLPGDAAWPAASAALADPRDVLTGLSLPVRDWLLQAAAGIAALPPDQRVAVTHALEQQEAAMFTQVLHALYAAYYATEAARLATLRLAAAGPLEPSPFFDSSLLER